MYPFPGYIFPKNKVGFLFKIMNEKRINLFFRWRKFDEIFNENLNEDSSLMISLNYNFDRNIRTTRQ